MKLVTITGIQLQFDSLGGVNYNEHDAQAIIDHLNKVIQENALVMEPKLTLTKQTEVLVINPLSLKEVATISK